LRQLQHWTFDSMREAEYRRVHAKTPSDGTQRFVGETSVNKTAAFEARNRVLLD
jgi:hypothetical protein